MIIRGNHNFPGGALSQLVHKHQLLHSPPPPPLPPDSLVLRMLVLRMSDYRSPTLTMSKRKKI